MVVHLISSPRNVSTALMYSFARRGDIKVVDEPFYAYYLNKYKVSHPGFDEIVASQPTDAYQIINDFRQLEKNGPVFLKDMAQHIDHLDLSFLLKHHIIILIRDPKEQIFSFAKVFQKPNVRDIGIKAQYDIVQFLQTQGKDFLVVDSNQLLNDPGAVLSKVCSAIKLPYSDRMLNWPAGPIPEDGIWAKFWYKNVHGSTGFKKIERPEIVLEGHLQSLYEDVRPYYEALLGMAS